MSNYFNNEDYRKEMQEMFSTMEELLSDVIDVSECYAMRPDKILVYLLADYAFICCVGDDSLDSRSTPKYNNDVYGYILSIMTDSNVLCNDVILEIIENHPDYRKYLELATLNSNLPECGVIFKEYLKKAKGANDDLIDFLHYYHDDFLPAVKKLVDIACMDVYPSYSKNEVSKAVKAKRSVAKKILDKLYAYAEIKGFSHGS